MTIDQKNKDLTATGILVVPSLVAVKNELALQDPAAIQIAPGEERDLESKADQVVAQLVGFEPKEIKEEQARKDAVEPVSYTHLTLPTKRIV